jgi:hypothetical protein
MEAMLEQEAACGVADSAVSVDLGKSHVTVEFVAHGDDYDQAVAKAMPAIRSAIHAVGGRTRTWPSHDEVMRHSPLEMIAQPAGQPVGQTKPCTLDLSSLSEGSVVRVQWQRRAPGTRDAGALVSARG